MKKLTGAILMISQLVLAANVGIIPTPQQIELTGQSVPLSSRADIKLAGNPQNLEKGQEILSEALAEMAGNSTAKPVAVILEKKADFNNDKLTKEQRSEAYSLEITSEKIEIQAQTDIGLFYGLMSLTQLVKVAEDGAIPTLKIFDYPDMAWRGVSDDFSRGQVSTMENFEAILCFLGEYKQNVYMAYMEDVIQLEKYPDIGVGRGALSKAEIAELQKIAKQYFVQIVPIFQTLGHYENILSDPNYMKYAEFPGAASLNSIDKKTDKFLFNMLDEVIPQFESDYFHIGCDESWDVGLGATKKLVEEKGTAQVHADHYNKVYKKITSEGKKVMMYGDIILRHPEIMDLIPKDIIIVDWHYWPTDHYPSVMKFKEAGFSFLVSPGIHNWRQFIPNFTNAWTNIANINYEGYLQGALGSINSNWGDYGGPNFRELNYMGYAFGAESSWNPSGMDGTTIRQRFLKQYFGTDCTAMESLILALNEIPNNTGIKRIFRNPFLPDQISPNIKLFSSAQLIQNGEHALKIIDQLRQKDIRNADKLDYFELGVRVGVLTGKKTLLKQKLNFYTENGYTDKITLELQQQFIDEANWLITELADLEKMYEELWLRANRPDNLEYLLTVMRQQSAYINRAKLCLEKGVYDINQEIPSLWVAAEVYDEEKEAAPAYLRKQFDINDPANVESAWLQVVGNDAAEVYLNGEKVGLVAATKSLSIIVEKKRVGYWDVSELLQEGINTIAVEVQAYKPKRPSCANVYFEYNTADGKTVIASDSTWQAATSVKKGWQTGKDKKGEWQKALVFTEYPWQISIPLFEEGFPSQLEF